MPNVQLNYFVENEIAESATKNFAVILQKAFEQYRKLWDKYLDLVKKYEDDSTTCEQNQKTWKEKNILKSTQILSENIDIFNKDANEMKSREKEKMPYHGEQNKNIIEDMFKVCNLDYDSDTCDTICQSQTPHKKIKNIILPESPIFMRKDEKLIPTISKNEILTNNDKTNSCTMETDDILNFNKQKNDDSPIMSAEHVNNISFNSISPTIICNTPTLNNECYKKNKQRLLKEQISYKYKQELKENIVNYKNPQVNEKNMSLEALQNVISQSKMTLNHNENKTRAKDFTEYKRRRVSPQSKKLKQTTLSFHSVNNKVDNAIVKSAEENIPITNCKKYLFKCKSYTESSSCQNEITSDRKINTMYIYNANKQNETIYEDIIANSPNSVCVQPHKKTPLKLKRKFSDITNKEVAELSESINEFDSAFTSPYASPIKMQHQTCFTNKKNIVLNDDTICFTSGMSVDTSKENLKLSKDTQLKQEPTKSNDFDETSSIDHHESSSLDVFQSGNEDETYFEEHIEEENNINVNKKSATSNKTCTSFTNQNLTDIHHESEHPKENTTKNTEIKTKVGWSCWECTEYYKNKPNLSEKHIQKWKNQCSRHRNIYYAGQTTPEGFWDPLFPPTASDSIQET